MSPITRETLAARIATLEADSNISIKEGFYLQTMRLLLAEMDKPAPHHNGMMQLSNELTDLKRNHAELQAVVDQRNGECDRLIKEQQELVMLVKVLVRTVKKYNHGSDLAKRATDYLTKNGLISATDFLRGGVLSAHEQVDTATAQFESLTGDKPASQPYKLNDPVIPDGLVMVPKDMTPEMMRAVQIKSELGGYAASELSGAYDMFAEFWDIAVSAAPHQEGV